MIGVIVATFVVALVPILAAAAIHRALLSRSLRPGATALPHRLPGARRARRLFVAAVLLGGVGGAVFGLAVAPAFDRLFAAWEPTLGLAFVRYAIAGPVAEELGKGLLLLALALAGRVRGSTSAMLIGIAAGAGFAAIENFAYAVVALGEHGTQGWWYSLRVRVGLGTFVHAASTAALGAYLGAAASTSSWIVRLAAIPASLFAASVVHGVWNGLLMMTDVTGQPVWALGALLWLAGAWAALGTTAALDLRRAGAGRSDAREQVT